MDLALPGTTRRLVDEINRGIACGVAGSEDLLLDVAHIAETVGLADWHDATLWNMAKLPFASAFLPLYAEHVCRLIAAIRGKGRKCLILDLDNTVWGGVIGDDGLEGIIIAQGDADRRSASSGAAHALDAARPRHGSRGVVKEHRRDRARPFREAPRDAAAEEHIAVFQANWNDKATNIRAIADELVARAGCTGVPGRQSGRARAGEQILPQVAVPELPKRPSALRPHAAAAGYFEAVAFSAEDLSAPNSTRTTRVASRCRGRPATLKPISRRWI